MTEAVKRAYKIDITPKISYPEAQLGDFATNVAFELSEQLKQPPVEVAKQLVSEIKHPDIESAVVAGSGFINLVMNQAFWIRQLGQIKPNYLQNNSGKGQKTQVEFISANPTGPLTLGNARGGFVGDVLSNVLATSDNKVTREYYFNDGGTQIEELIRSIKAAAGEKVEGEIAYRGEYLKDLTKFYRRTKETDLSKVLTAYIWEEYLEPAIKSMGVSFDIRTNERGLEQSYQTVLKALKSSKLVAARDDAIWLLSTKLGDERDRVLEKKQGGRTYLANDLAYHWQIFKERGFDRSVKVWGADHAGQVPSLKLTIQQLLPDRVLEFVIVQWVRLIRDGKEYKISKRAGTYVTVDELLEEIPTEVVRWFFLMRSANTHMDFDMDLAKEESQKNPFYYVMYAYTRAHSILGRASGLGIKPNGQLTEVDVHERQLIRQLLQLPELVRDIAQTHGVHQLTFYGIELARLFHEYYEADRIIDLPKSQAAAKLYLVDQFRVAMEAYWKLLGIHPKTKM